ncbi:hypothetical protein [Methylobacterium fujisawaense]|uniref:hypothetical protein n=1 Tax=Methylobacterium fujisawaense TaxID=107400 RepID=UPI00313BC60D
MGFNMAGGGGASVEARLLSWLADQAMHAKALEMGALRRAPGRGAASPDLVRELALHCVDGPLQLFLPELIQPLVEQSQLDVLNSRTVDGIKHRALASDDVDADDCAGGSEKQEVLLGRGYP